MSRLENGSREPTADAVAKIADALGLASEQRAELFLSARLAPDRQGDLVAFVVGNLGGSPALELARFMADPSEPEASKTAVARAVRGMVRHG